MMVDSKKNELSVAWRLEVDYGIEEKRGIPVKPPAKHEHLGLITADDPVEMLLATYDFSALHDRIMMAIAAKPMKSSRKEKLS